MDIFQTARYMDIQKFDVWDNVSKTWIIGKFVGQFKKTDTFTEIWNRPTRKRLLTCAPDQVPTGYYVVRVQGSGEVFMVGADHRDAWGGFYRYIAGLHKVKGQAQQRRLAPTGPSNNPGWAVSSLVDTMYGDCELRSAEENQDKSIQHFGSYFAFFPLNTNLQRNDTIVFPDITLQVLEFYLDSGLMCARCTVDPDARINFVYTSIGTETYNPNTQQASTPSTSYNVTGRTKVYEDKEATGDENVLADAMRLMILRSWIPVIPKLNDYVTIGAQRFNVEDVTSNALGDEWYLAVRI